ncbi:ammonium transporter [Microterricola viridarii]|uniref:Ammonium transporter n=1 Tax=Microterricola viridarii TaxID=412690 RepID=A0A1H1TUY7_9MICO|nr:ammonium transporter [Microterricola viridarii]SDS64010.1 ammonium transporter, Amt family [Microterricola viridarii]
MNYDDPGFVLAFAALLPVLAAGLALLGGLRMQQLPWVAAAAALVLALWALAGAQSVLGADASPGLSIFYGMTVALTAVQLGAVMPRETAAAGGRVPLIGWLVFVAGWTLIVAFPVAGWTLNLVDGWLVVGLGLLDFGGAALLFLGTSAAGLGWLLVARNRGPIVAVAAPRRAVLTIAALWIGFFAVTVGSEAVPDATALGAAANTVVAPLCAALAWAVVERIRHRRFSLDGAVRGVFAGLVAISAAADVLSPFWAGVLGLAAGAVASAIAGPRGSVFGLLLTQFAAAALGLVFIGILGDGVGGLLTGSWMQLGTQLFSIAVVTGFAFAFAATLAFVIRRVSAQLVWLRERPELAK